MKIEKNKWHKPEDIIASIKRENSHQLKVRYFELFSNLKPVQKERFMLQAIEIMEGLKP